MDAKAKLGTRTKQLAILFNVLLFLAAVEMIDRMESTEESSASEVHMPDDSMLPHVTMTDEMKVGKFFDNLYVDQSVINPKQIKLSISPWEKYIRLYSKEYRVDPDLVRAIIYAESKGDPYSISRTGAIGLMQLMPSTAAYVGIDDILDPEENIKGGVKYIAWLVKRYGEERSLWAWNAGPSRLKTYKMPKETQKFIVEVLSVKTYLKDRGFNTI